MKTSQDGIEILHYFEQLKLKAYPDPASALFKALQAVGIDPYNLDTVPAKFLGLSGAPWTIGYGHTGPEVVAGLRWTKEKANDAFASRLSKEFEPGVSLAVVEDTSPSEFDAMVSLAYNIGVRAFSGSTLVKLHNSGARDEAADQFLAWNKADGVSMLGLRRRRAAERARYLGATGLEAIEIGKAAK